MRTAAAEAAVSARSPAVLLCTLTAPDGRVVRAATAPITVSADQGGPWLYDHFVAGIDSFTEEIDVFSLDATAALTQVQVEIVTTDDFAALAASWHHLLGTEVEVASIWPGERWEARRVLLRGPMQALELGRLGEATSFAAEAAPAVTSAQIGDDARDLADDYGTGLVDVNGDDITDPTGAYPIILGVPLRVAAVKVGEVGGSGKNRVVLCGHELPAMSNLPTYQDDVSAASQAAVNGSVTSGKIAYVESATLYNSPSAAADNGSVTVDFRWGGIARHDSATEPTLSAADVLAWLLANSGLLVDWDRMRRTLAKLRSWPVGAAITQQSTCIEVARDLAKLLPIIEVPGADGVWFAYADPESAPVEGTLTVGAELIGGSGRVVVSDRDVIRNRFTMRYLRNSFDGRYEESVTLNADNSALCALSEQIYGDLADDVIDGDWIWDSTTALRALNARAGRLALPRRSRDYVLSPDAYTVNVGSVYRVIDPDYNIDARGYIRARSGSAPYLLTVDLVDRTPMGAL